MSHRARSIILALLFCAGMAQAAPAPRDEEVPHVRIVDRKGKTLTRAIYTPVPVYPFKARVHNMGGEGLFRMRLRPDGTVSAVEVFRSTGVKELDIAAARALIRWRFTPPAPELKAVGVPVDFRIKRRISGGGTILG